MIRKCLHCGEILRKDQKDFCCLGCLGAYKIINNLGLEKYYNIRQDNDQINIKPDLDENEETKHSDISEFLTENDDNSFEILLLVQGIHCAACIWLIETLLSKQENVIKARINLSQRTLFLKFSGDKSCGNKLVNLVEDIGYKVLPFNKEAIDHQEKKYNDDILKSLAVAGFGAGNVMLFSLSLWFDSASQMGEATRSLLHIFTSIIALPVLIYSSRIFIFSAYKSIKAGVANMDLAISIAVILTAINSFIQTKDGASHVYFDSAIMLVFFLLIGRFFEAKARKKAFNIVSEFALLSASFSRVEEGDKIKTLPIAKLKKGMILNIGVGEKIAIDSEVISGESEIDSSLIDGEILPKRVSKGSYLYAGMLNISAPIRIRAVQEVKNSFIAKIISLLNGIENSKNSFVKLSDKLVKFYLPAVHLISFITFLFWLSTGWKNALTNAVSVLIITCPCALALAIPIVQSIAISNLIKKSVLVKAGDALEILNKAKNFVFDKTGTITTGEFDLVKIINLKNGLEISKSNCMAHLKIAASMAKHSRHLISKSLLKSYDGDLLNFDVKEEKGFGLLSRDEKYFLGRKEFCKIKTDFHTTGFVKAYAKFGEDELLFLFKDKLKDDAKTVISWLQEKGKNVILLSGDNEDVVTKVANELAIKSYYFEQTPISKLDFLKELKSKKEGVVMFGDGINDAPSLLAADVSVSFSKASDISQNIADVIIHKNKLAPIFDLLGCSKKSIRLMKQNLCFALIYNMTAIPFAFFGFVTPLIAALSMSFSSLLVLFNSLRINKK